MSVLTTDVSRKRTLLKGDELRKAIADYVRLNFSLKDIEEMYESEDKRSACAELVVPRLVVGCEGVEQAQIYLSLKALHIERSCRLSWVRNVIMDMKEGKF